MRILDHPNVVSLKHCFYSSTDKDEVFLNLVLEYVPETVYRIAKHYNRMSQRMPLIFVKLYTYQVDKYFLQGKSHKKYFKLTSWVYTKIPLRLPKTTRIPLNNTKFTTAEGYSGNLGNLGVF